MTPKPPRKVYKETETPLGKDADTMIYCTGAGVYISRREAPEISFHRFNEKEIEIIQKMEKGEI